MYRFKLIVILFFISSGISGQIDSAEVYRQLFEEDEILEPTKEEKEKKEKEPFVVFVGLQPSLYFANNNIANYYNGSVREILYEERYVIQTVWDNPNNKRIIKDDLFLTDVQYDGVEFDESNFNYNMNYDIGYLIGFQAFFVLQERFSILLGFNFVSLNTASVISFSVPDLGSPNPDINNTQIQMDVFGKEQRFIIDLGMHWILGKRDLKYYVEGGVNFLMAKANENYFKTEDHTWHLRRAVGNAQAANTITSATFGGFAGFGLFYKASEDFALEFGPQVAINSVEFPGRTGYFPNYLINLRIIYLSGNAKM